MGAIAASLILWWTRSPAVPVVEAVEQLTDDGEPKQGRLVSDGSRVYFNEGPTGSWKIAQVSVTGGRTALVDTRLVNPQIEGRHPMVPRYLLCSVVMRIRAYPLWWLPLPAGEPRRLGSVDAQGAGVFPDGPSLSAKDQICLSPRRTARTGASWYRLQIPLWYPSVSPNGKRIVFGMDRGETKLVA